MQSASSLSCILLALTIRRDAALEALNGATARPLVQNVTHVSEDPIFIEHIAADADITLLKHTKESSLDEISFPFPFLLYAIEDKREIFATDGRSEGIKLASWDQSTDSSFAPYEAHYYKGKFYFFIGSSLWFTDGTASGTKRAKEFDEEVIYGTTTFLTFQNELYIAIGSSLYKTDGSSLPVLVHTFPSSIRDMGGFENFILTTSRPNYEEETTDVHKTDGSGAILLTSDAFEARVKPFYRNPVLKNGHILFPAQNGLWRTDGTPGGTVKFTSHGGSEVMRFGAQNLFANGKVHTGVNRFSFTTGGTESSTQPLLPCSDEGTPQFSVPSTTCLDVQKSTAISGHGHAAAFDGLVGTGTFINGRLMLLAQGNVEYSNKTLVYMTDGTGVGTEKVTEVPFAKPYEGQILSDGRLILVGFNQNEATDQIWIVDETSEGTILVADLGNELLVNHVVESMDDSFLLVSIGNSLWRLDLPARPTPITEPGPDIPASELDPVAPGAGSDSNEPASNLDANTETSSASTWKAFHSHAIGLVIAALILG